jgi:polar amino acid transport system ATP-binding protein
MLSINNAYKKFNSAVVLNNISLNIERHSIVGLAGPSGGGKSTLLRCIQKLESLDSGSIRFKEKSSFMFQDFQLFPHMKVLDNLTYAPRINRKSFDYNLRAMHLLETLGIVDKADHFPFQLSGGQKQRVALARSLMMQPKLLLCDEPTSGLDVATIEDVVKLLFSIHDMGVSMIVASHDLDFLTKLTDRIIILKTGKIVSDVNTRDLENPIHYLKTFY